MNVHFTLTILSALLVFYPIGADAAESRLSSGENLGQEEKILSGTVVDSKTGDPLVGVTVVQQGNPEYALTDLDGRFTFELSESNDSDIEFSFIGYKTYTVPPEEGKITVRMEQDLQVLEESQVIAYGTQSKMSITGSITSIETKDLLKSPSGSAASALAGAVTGISSIQTSGQPGADDPEEHGLSAGSLPVFLESFAQLPHRLQPCRAPGTNAQMLLDRRFLFWRKYAEEVSAEPFYVYMSVHLYCSNILSNLSSRLFFRRLISCRSLAHSFAAFLLSVTPQCLATISSYDRPSM